MKQKYQDINFRRESLGLIAICNDILEAYAKAGYTITVRTLYYQLVSRDIIPNQEKSYKNLTNLVNSARLAGLLDWDVIEDRGRRPVVRPHWKDGAAILKAVADQFYMDHWKGQERRVFVVVEKDALAGVLESTCRTWDVPLLAAKGYPSSSSVRDLVRELMFPLRRDEEGELLSYGQRPEIVMLHMGDHDPSGLDMSRDLEERLKLFCDNQLYIDFERIALNMPQIEEVNPPPNPAKVQDSRFEDYQRQYGDESWELDALPPEYLNNLLETKVREHIDFDQWEAVEEEIEDTRKRLKQLSEKW